MNEPIPDAWPPEEGSGAHTKHVVPLFPLPQVWLFPYVVLPLYIFEERYRQMVEDCLDGPGRIVLGTVREGHEGELSASPPVYSIAGLGEIGRHKRLEKDHFDIWLVGLQRVSIREVHSARLYRLVEIEPAIEVEISEQRERELRRELVDAILERTEHLTLIPQQVPISHLTDLLTLRIPLPHEVLSQLYCELDTEKRARRALAEHGSRPKLERGEGDPPNMGFFPRANGPDG